MPASDPYYEDESVTLYHGDCLAVMATLPDDSVDAIACDPPYGLGFMGKAWDDLPPGLPWAQECLRVLKPGGHLLAFGGTRTWHRLAVAVEDAGFEMRDSIAWLHSQGFPKSLDVSKAIDKVRTEDLEPQAAVAKWLVDQMVERGITRRNISDHFGTANAAQQWTTHWTTGAVKPRVPSIEQWAELRRWLELPDEMDAEVWRLNGKKGKPGEAFQSRDVLGLSPHFTAGRTRDNMSAGGEGGTAQRDRTITAPATPAAQQWAGWGTALKPAHEPIVVARKPLAGTIAHNVLTYGTGALNIDATRVPHGDDVNLTAVQRQSAANDIYVGGAKPGDTVQTYKPGGRWPTNVVLDGDAAAELDGQSGTLKSGDVAGSKRNTDGGNGFTHGAMTGVVGASYADSGGASRFFPVFRYQAKAPTRERPSYTKPDGTKIAHPTCKPLELMRWLVRLVTPPGGVCLDPFAGSGTTVEAAILEGFQVIAVEREADYLPLIEARIARNQTTDEGQPAAVDALALFDVEEPA